MAAPAATTGRLTISPAWAPPGRPSAHTGPAALPASLARPAFPRKAHLCDTLHLTTALAHEDIPSFMLCLRACLYRLMQVTTEGPLFSLSAHVACCSCTHTEIWWFPHIV